MRKAVISLIFVLHLLFTQSLMGQIINESEQLCTNNKSCISNDSATNLSEQSLQILDLLKGQLADTYNKKKIKEKELKAAKEHGIAGPSQLLALEEEIGRLSNRLSEIQALCEKNAKSAPDKPARIDAKRKLLFLTLSRTVPDGFDVCKAMRIGRWQIHQAEISTSRKGAMCIVNGLYSCHEFLVRQDGFDCVTGSMATRIDKNGLPSSGKAYISGSHKLEDDPVSAGMDHHETRAFLVGICKFKVTKTGNTFNVQSFDLEYPYNLNPFSDRDMIGIDFPYGVRVTSTSVNDIPFKKDCFEGL